MEAPQERRSRPLTKSLLGIVGRIVALAALVFVGWTLVRAGALEADLWATPGLWRGVALAALAYAVSLMVIPPAWAGLVHSASPVRLPYGAMLWVYALSQLYKYLPSNVLHYVGRQMMLTRRGVPHAAAAWGSVAEALIIVLAGAAIAALFGLATLAEMASPEALRRIAILTGAGAALGVAALVAAFMLRDRLPDFARRLLGPEARWAALRAFALYLAFFVLSGAAFVLVAGVFADAPAAQTLIAVAAGAWVLGFVTPGASAGIGVREALMIAGLTAAGMGADTAGAAAIAWRLVTILGDVVFSGAAWALSRTVLAEKSADSGI